MAFRVHKYSFLLVRTTGYKKWDLIGNLNNPITKRKNLHYVVVLSLEPGPQSWSRIILGNRNNNNIITIIIIVRVLPPWTILRRLHNIETFTLTNYTNFYFQNQLHLSSCLTYILSLSILFLYYVWSWHSYS